MGLNLTDRTIPKVPGIAGGPLNPYIDSSGGGIPRKCIGYTGERINSGAKRPIPYKAGGRKSKPLTGAIDKADAIGKRRNDAPQVWNPETAETRFYIIKGRRVNVRRSK